MLITFDRDFGALSFKQGVSAPEGIMLLRFIPVTPLEPAAVLFDLLGDSRLAFRGKFTAVDRERVRQRSLQTKVEGG